MFYLLCFSQVAAVDDEPGFIPEIEEFDDYSDILPPDHEFTSSHVTRLNTIRAFIPQAHCGSFPSPLEPESLLELEDPLCLIVPESNEVVLDVFPEANSAVVDISDFSSNLSLLSDNWMAEGFHKL